MRRNHQIPFGRKRSQNCKQRVPGDVAQPAFVQRIVRKQFADFLRRGRIKFGIFQKNFAQCRFVFGAAHRSKTVFRSGFRDASDVAFERAKTQRELPPFLSRRKLKQFVRINHDANPVGKENPCDEKNWISKKISHFANARKNCARFSRFKNFAKQIFTKMKSCEKFPPCKKSRASFPQKNFAKKLGGRNSTTAHSLKKNSAPCKSAHARISKSVKFADSRQYATFIKLNKSSLVMLRGKKLIISSWPASSAARESCSMETDKSFSRAGKFALAILCLMLSA